MIVSRNNNTDGYRLSLYSDNKFIFEVEENGTQNQAKADSAITSADTWYHLVGTFNGDPSNNNSGVVKLYVNSSNTGITNDTAANDMDATIAGITIGNHFDGSEGFFGQIDDLLIYDKVLIQTEITRIYNAGKRSHR